MPTSIIIGFEYSLNPLPGAYIDIYNAFKWGNSFNSDTYIISDVDYNINKNNITQAINNNYIDIDIHMLSTYPKIILDNGIDLSANIKTILSYGIIDNKLIIYYSGHGINNSMIMPNSSLLSFNTFKNIIFQNISHDVEVFIILDCCNPNGLSLPYKLHDNCFRLITNNHIEFIPNNILLITSSNENEKSLATIYGSVFSKSLFNLLTLMNINYPITTTINKNSNRNLQRLISTIKNSIRKLDTGYHQSVSIYTSFIIDPLLWMWIGSNKNYNIITDSTLNTLIII